MAVAILGVLIFAAFGANLDDRLKGLELPPEARQQLEAEKEGKTGSCGSLRGH